jgi:hypothetical protein
MICSTNYSSSLQKFTSVHHFLMTNSHSTSYLSIVDNSINIYHISTRISLARTESAFLNEFTNSLLIFISFFLISINEVKVKLLGHKGAVRDHPH